MVLNCIYVLFFIYLLFYLLDIHLKPTGRDAFSISMDFISFYMRTLIIFSVEILQKIDMTDRSLQVGLIFSLTCVQHCDIKIKSIVQKHALSVKTVKTRGSGGSLILNVTRVDVIVKRREHRVIWSCPSLSARYIYFFPF